MRRPVVASSSPRSIRSQRGSTLERRAHRHRTVPTCWRAREVPICHLLGEECTALRARQEPEHRVFAIFSTFRDTARWLANGERSCGSWRRRRAVRSFGQTGTNRGGGTPVHGGLSLRPNGARRGKIPCAPSRCISAQPFLQTSRRAGFCRAAAENFRPEIFEARAT